MELKALGMKQQPHQGLILRVSPKYFIRTSHILIKHVATLAIDLWGTSFDYLIKYIDKSLTCSLCTILISNINELSFQIIAISLGPGLNPFIIWYLYISFDLPSLAVLFTHYFNLGKWLKFSMLMSFICKTIIIVIIIIILGLRFSEK